MLLAATLSLAIWTYLLLGHGRFWQSGPTLPAAGPPTPAPALAIIVPARDEAASIGRALRSLLAQDYPGPWRIILVDDGSQDGTADIAASLADPRLTIITCAERPPGWSGKLWALHQGIEAASATSPRPMSSVVPSSIDPSSIDPTSIDPSSMAPFATAKSLSATSSSAKSQSATSPASPSAAPELLLLTDADIEHHPAHAATLAAKALADDLDLVSEMVALNCQSAPERALVPAFVFFFALLYPFDLVNDPASRTAAAAGGTILIRASALDRIGGLTAMRGALIDDVTLAALVKKAGRIWLGHSALAASIRPYPHAADIWRMVTRTAFVQLRFSPWLLTATILGMAIVWLMPPIAALAGHGPTRAAGALAWLAMSVAYTPTLRRFRLSLVWAPFLPLVALFYTAATIGSAAGHWQGRGVIWKRRSYG